MNHYHYYVWVPDRVHYIETGQHGSLQGVKLAATAAMEGHGHDCIAAIYDTAEAPEQGIRPLWTRTGATRWTCRTRTPRPVRPARWEGSSHDKA